MRFLEEQGIGFETPVARVPIVPAAVLFDLGVGDPAARPGPDQGYEACMAAGEDVREGNIGAGVGATVAKLHGEQGAVKGGLGTASRQEGDLIAGAMAAVNALGEIVDEDGTVVAGSRVPPESVPEESPPSVLGPMNTTLVVAATNARLSKDRAHLVALAAHDGISAAVRPAHTLWDGDTAFVLATGRLEAEQRALEAMVTAAVAEAIRRAVLAAEGIPGIPSVRELGASGA
jgi:L-aminopeptidase/D-esterase-like protein